jgi:hypothetical protein
MLEASSAGCVAWEARRSHLPAGLRSSGAQVGQAKGFEVCWLAEWFGVQFCVLCCDIGACRLAHAVQVRSLASL